MHSNLDGTCKVVAPGQSTRRCSHLMGIAPGKQPRSDGSLGQLLFPLSEALQKRKSRCRLEAVTKAALRPGIASKTWEGGGGGSGEGTRPHKALPNPHWLGQDCTNPGKCVTLTLLLYAGAPVPSAQDQGHMKYSTAELWPLPSLCASRGAHCQQRVNLYITSA